MEILHIMHFTHQVQIISSNVRQGRDTRYLHLHCPERWIFVIFVSIAACGLFTPLESNTGDWGINSIGNITVYIIFHTTQIGAVHQY